MKRIWIILCCLLLRRLFVLVFSAVSCCANRTDLKTRKHESAFNAADFAKTFWSEQLIPSLNQAPDAATVLADLS